MFARAPPEDENSIQSVNKAFLTQLATCLATLGLFQATTVNAVEPRAWEMTAADVVTAAKNTAHLVNVGNRKQAAELDGALQLEAYGLNAHLSEGWWRVILPATLKPYDLQPAAAPLPLKAAGPLAALKLPDNAATVWLHDLAPKPGAQVALTAGGKPALVLGQAGKGRVALLTLAPLGEDVAGAWWRSDAGEKIMEATCRWLLGSK